MSTFADFLGILEGDEFEERPVAIEEFVMSKEFLGQPGLSEHQYQMVKSMTQVYKKDTLIRLLGQEEGEKRWSQTCNEVIFQLGKGSGKDYSSTIACAYIVYLLLCLKDPAKYYGKPPGNAIDIINIAINAVQANRVFFKDFTNLVKRSPWFQGRFDPKATSIEFDKAITVHSGHSQREAWEGYNVILVILDEISGFDLESTSGHAQAKTADSIYKMYRGSVDSRFPDIGKVALLSFPRFKNDYIQQKYNEAVETKETIIRTHTFKIDPDLPDEIEENFFSVEWEEDHIIHYKYPKVFALKRPTWEVNPQRHIEDFTIAFYSDPIDALSRFACMPPDALDAFFKSREKIEKAFSSLNPNLDEQNRFQEWFKPEDGKIYYVHVDLAQKHDRCAVTMAHVDSWKKIRVGSQTSEAAPYVIVDAIRWWTPKSTESVNFTEVKEYILSLRHRGFDVRMVTFDRWNSHDMMQQLKASGMNCEVLSVAKKHYEDMALVVMEERLFGPRNEILINELLQLRIIKDKVDHPRSGSKDLADATCGAIFNAISLTPPDLDQEIEIRSYDWEDEINPVKKNPSTIEFPRQVRQMPDMLRDFLDNIGDIEDDGGTRFVDNFTIL